jgi:basic membrane lipoprotein Med (substrate-binding protein (PBP1-ABC) superfamily)
MRVLSLLRRLFVLFVLAALFGIAALVAACATTPAPTPTAQIRTDYRLALVLNAQGPLRDGTFSETAYNGAKRAARDFGLDLTYRETVEDKDYPGALEAMIADKRNILITVGFQMQQATLDAAKAHPDAYFIGVDQTPDNPPSNYVGVTFREDQGGFLAGALASMLTKSNVVAVVAGVQLPPVERFVNGYGNGARYVNPQVKVLSTYSTSFDDVQQGSDKADQMIDQGADVVFGAGGLTGSSAIARAASKGKFVIGVDQDEFKTTFASGKDAQYIITSAIKRVDTGIYTIVDSILKKNFKGGLLTLSATNCGIAYAPFHTAEKDIPDTVKTRLETIWRALADGTLTTGADTTGASTPAPLAAGASPAINDSAPRLSDCTLN